MSTETAAEGVLAGLGNTRVWQEAFYQDVHQHPELSHQEHRTASAVSERLRGFGFEVHEGVGGTGVVGKLRNGAGASVLLRADMDALPVKERTGLPYASTATAVDAAGDSVPVMHACGHDVHVTCLLGAAELMAGARDRWHGTLVVLFQSAEELGDGAKRMVTDGLTDLVGPVDAALAQHVLALPAGTVGTRTGSVLSAADSMRVTVHGRGAHGSMPQSSIDPVVLAAMIVVRLQTVISREIAPTEPAVLTVGSIRGGTKSNVIGDRAVLELNVRTYDESTRNTVMEAIRRIVVGECQASGTPSDPEFELFDQFPATVNDAATTERLHTGFTAYFGDRAQELPLQSASEDFSDIPEALGVPYSYWGLGGIDAETYRAAEAAGRVAQDIPVNHSPLFAPVIQPTLDTGTEALVVAALAWLGTDWTRRLLLPCSGQNQRSTATSTGSRCSASLTRITCGVASPAAWSITKGCAASGGSSTPVDGSPLSSPEKEIRTSCRVEDERLRSR
jgi:hippurate hydrolase